MKAEQQDALEAAAQEWAKCGYPGSGAVFNHLALTVEDIWPVEEPQWVLRTWADVVTGDEVRMPGTEVTASIAMRYRHPSEDPTGRSWHVVPLDMTPGPWAHTKDHVVQPGECVVQMEGRQKAFFADPAAPVEIKLTAEEVKLFDRLGWANRVKQA